MRAPSLPRSRPARGVTLIELLVALTVMAILAGIAVPSFTTFMQRSALSTEADALASALSVARANALSRNTWVTVAPINADWQNGWTVCLNPTRNADCTGLNVILQRARNTQDLTIGFSSTPQATALSYSPVGYTRTLADTMQSAQILMTLGNANQRLVDVSQLGRVRVCTPTTTTPATCQ